MAREKIAHLNETELAARLEDLKKELREFRFQKVVGQVETKPISRIDRASSNQSFK